MIYMTDKVTYITADGLEKLKVELEELKTVRLRELANRVDAAKSLGDLSENAEYHDAKDDLAMTHARIRQIEEMLKNVSIITSEGETDTVRIGSTVELEYSGGKKKSYKIVGSNEADPLNGLISNESPLGSAFLDRKKGEKVDVETPGGTIEYKIVSIS